MTLISVQIKAVSILIINIYFLIILKYYHTLFFLTFKNVLVFLKTPTLFGIRKADKWRSLQLLYQIHQWFFKYKYYDKYCSVISKHVQFIATSI